MIGLRRALVSLALAAVVGTAGTIALIADSDHADNKALNAVLGTAITLSFIGTGLYAWWRRPANRFGALMTAVGFAYLLGALTYANSSLWFSIGTVVSSLYAAVFAHMLLSYPTGRLAHRWHRGLLAVAYVLVFVAPLGLLMTTDQLGNEDLPPSAFTVTDDPDLYRAWDIASSALGVVVLALALGIVYNRWRSTPPAQRALQAPVLWAGIALFLAFAVALTSDSAGLVGLSNAMAFATLAAFAATPWLFLLGLARTRMAGADAVRDLLARLGDALPGGGLRDLLADALRDPTLQIVYWIDDQRRYVRADGHVATLPAEDDPVRVATAVELEGRRVGAIVHDRVLCEDPDLVGSMAAATALAMHNERLQAELRARLEQLRASRARIVEVGIAERRRLERNLHDGAQQRLVALSLTLRLAQGRLTKDPAAAGELLTGAQAELEHALAELRELARGIHPAILSDRGLGAALEALAGRSPVPVELAGTPGERLPPAVEAAAYFVISEALANVAKYAHATRATVSVERANGAAVVEVADDGIGGADPVRGSGLRGLADRVAALDGRLELDSEPGAGTRLRAEIPV